MPKLDNSKRRFDTATYVPVRKDDSPEDTESSNAILRGFEKTGYVKSLKIRPHEIKPLRIAVRETIEDPSDLSILKLVDLIEDMVAKDSPSQTLAAVQKIARFDHEKLIKIGRLLADIRHSASQKIGSALRAMAASFHSRRAADGGAIDLSRLTVDRSPEIVLDITAETVETGESTTSLDPGSDFFGPIVDEAPGGTDVTLMDVMAWGKKEEPEMFSRISNSAGLETNTGGTLYSLFDNDLVATHDLVINWRDWAPGTNDIVDGFEESMKIEPIGRLHLERLEMIPAGIERGELLYTIPMAPNEIVNVVEKEWSVRNREFSRIVQDSFEGFSEEGVSEKTDLSQSTESQSARESAYSLSGSYQYMGASAAFGYQSSAKDEHAAKESRNHTIGITRRSSARVKKDHKYSIRVVEEAGESRTAGRRIENKTGDVFRLEYYQLIRKWQVDLYRYGLRMTYDVVIPGPGADLLKKIEEIESLEAKLAHPFQFDLPVTKINRNNWDGLAARYGALVEAPPPRIIDLTENKVFTDDSTEDFFDVIEINVDERYEILKATIVGRFDPDNDNPNRAYFDVLLDSKGPVRFDEQDADEEGRMVYQSQLKYLRGMSGDLVVAFGGQRLREGVVLLLVRAKLKPDEYRHWRLSAWDAMREAAEVAFLQAHDRMKAQLEALKEELSGKDALQLRQMEREEVMKGVLRWLFGPDFQIVPSDIGNILSAVSDNSLGGISDAQWGRVMSYGEFIKFIHQAIEWENVIFFLYPYFWSSSKRELKRHLVHPDPRHREFLRAGAARVVLPIRPGFEKSFSELAEKGSFGDLEEGHPYITIAEEIQNFAETNYPGIPPANPENEQPEEVEEAERGILIGRWYEYTPSSGVDISKDQSLSEIA